MSIIYHIMIDSDHNHILSTNNITIYQYFLCSIMVDVLKFFHTQKKKENKYSRELIFIKEHFY